MDFRWWLGMGVSTSIYSFSTSVTFAIFFITISGLMNAPLAIARRTMLQQNTEREVRGRVFGAIRTLQNVLMLLGLNRVFLSKMTERMLRMERIDSPKITVLDQQVLRDLRTAEPEVATQN
jgi:hypothetical protein